MRGLGFLGPAHPQPSSVLCMKWRKENSEAVSSAGARSGMDWGLALSLSAGLLSALVCFGFHVSRQGFAGSDLC